MMDLENSDTNGSDAYGATVPSLGVPNVLPWNRKRSFDAMIEEADSNTPMCYLQALAASEHRGDEMFFVEPRDVSELRFALVREALRMEAWLDSLTDEVVRLEHGEQLKTSGGDETCEKTQTVGELHLYPGNHPYVALPLLGHEVASAHLQNQGEGGGRQEG